MHGLDHINSVAHFLTEEGIKGEVLVEHSSGKSAVQK